jgi:hypothetical protein
MKFKKLNKFLLLTFLYGCSIRELDISNLEVASSLYETCFKTTAPMDVYSLKKNSSTKHELLSPKAKWCRDDIFMESCKKAFEISEGNELKITKIFNKLYGSSGHCWLVYASAKSNPGVEFEIPSCFIDQNTDLWVHPRYSDKKDSQQLLELKTEFLEEIQCSF